MINFKYSDAVILVFAKAPILGEVNTRLIPDIGIDAATELQIELVHSRLKGLQEMKLCEVELWCSPDSSHIFFQECKNIYDIILCEQQGDDLGSRMSLAIKESLTKFKRVILIGTDAPSLTFDQIEVAINDLGKDNDVVIAPAEDGGYVLIGMSKHCDDIFQSVPWGTEKVLGCTRESIKKNKLIGSELKLCWDIDRVEDYRRYKKMML